MIASGAAPDDRMLAIVPVRAGELPDGGAEVVAEAGGRAVLVGEGATAAAAALRGIGRSVDAWEVPDFRPAAWAAAIAPWLGEEDVVLLPANPDGRDLAPRLAHACGRPLLAGAIRVAPGRAHVARAGGLVVEELVIDGPFVATLQPGVRGVDVDHTLPPPDIPTPGRAQPGVAADPVTVAVLPADPATMDLQEAERIIGGGAGLGSAEAFELLRAVGLATGASMGGTRVVADWGWIPFERQIGTTGVIVAPRVYLAFGISGAVQHTAGLGQPEHVIAVNLDGSCPMMALADLAVVADAPATLRALAARLGVAVSHG